MLALPLRGSTPELYHGKYIASMFANGEQGAWFDPSDLSTLYQDAAGTTPVTAVEQPVGRMLDKSGRGNHATQATTASRPVLSARVNLLVRSEEFGSSSWSKGFVTVTENAVLAPDQTFADAIIETVTSGIHEIWQPAVSLLAGTKYRASFWLKRNGRNRVRIAFDSTRFGTSKRAIFNLETGTVSSFSTEAASILGAGDGWYICSVEQTCTSSGTSAPFYTTLLLDGSDAVLYAGDGTSGVYVWRADLRVANESTIIPSYQRVNTATDYETQGFPYYLRFDGVDDWLVTNSINFTGTDKVTVAAGVRKLSDAAAGSIVELSATPTAADNFARFFITAASANAETYGLGMTSNSGTSGTYQIRALTYKSPITNVAAALFDSSIASGSSRVVPRVNAAAPQSIQVGFEQEGSVPVKFGSFPIFVGRRGGTTFPFNGRLYGLIVRGVATDDLHLTHAEKYLAYKSGVTL